MRTKKVEVRPVGLILCTISLCCWARIITGYKHINCITNFIFVDAQQVKMGLQDVVYTAVTAPFNVIYKTSVGTASYAWGAASSATDYLGLHPKVVEPKMVPPELYKLAAASGPYIRLAAISGAAAVILGAVGSHRHYSNDEVGREQRRIFETANRYHFIHTLALLGLPMCKYSSVAATFMLSGILLFCGSCYYTAFTGDRRFSSTTPFGGFCFILGWCSIFF
ncbi:uncharacterized protein LOC114943025 isoform X2 [Nylanderia fulva]|uniref:uncharacterized protein LOC114943025 isoform X2 n=1 Tax=Nylanderia fulva TaxID=613905 RepID=UPI0010FBB127|nr:uncharacterized protein LOC114943025 isoform X2 [Nylanderia fulva]